MLIDRTHHIDASEPDESGMYDYYYEYDIYRFTDESSCLVARSYTSEPEEAHFLRIEANGNPRSMEDTDLSHPLFLAASAYLCTEGKLQFRWLSGRGDGYESVPFGQQHGA
jgi:hypothetical protein